MRRISELLPPDDICLQLKKKADRLEKILFQKKKALSDVPEGNLRVSVCNKNKQYYWIKKDSGKNGTYISHSEIDFAKQLAQKEYDSVSVKAIEKELCLIKNYLKKTEFYENCNFKFTERKLDLVTPLTLENEAYVREWLNLPYQKKEFKEGQKVFTTSSGLQVRSKSEVIIAELLEKNTVPFRYEQKLKFSAFNVYPDFTCLNIRTRKEYVWEHFGLLDDVDYVKTAVEKIHYYQKSGYFPGKNLIITTENQDYPLSSNLVQQVIDEYFM